MFGAKKKTKKVKSGVKQPDVNTLLGHGSQITGDLEFSGGLHVDGSVVGNVMTNDGGDGTLVLSPDGRVEGDIHVPKAIINGEVIGDIYSTSHIELAPQARITGNVYYNLLEMEVGAEVNGSLIHKADPSTPAPRMIGFTDSGSDSDSGSNT